MQIRTRLAEMPPRFLAPLGSGAGRPWGHVVDALERAEPAIVGQLVDLLQFRRTEESGARTAYGSLYDLAKDTGRHPKIPLRKWARAYVEERALPEIADVVWYLLHNVEAPDDPPLETELTERFEHEDVSAVAVIARAHHRFVARGEAAQFTPGLARALSRLDWSEVGDHVYGTTVKELLSRLGHLDDPGIGKVIGDIAGRSEPALLPTLCRALRGQVDARSRALLRRAHEEYDFAFASDPHAQLVGAPVEKIAAALGAFKLHEGTSSVSFRWRSLLSLDPTSRERIAMAYEHHLAQTQGESGLDFGSSFAEFWKLAPERALAFGRRALEELGTASPPGLRYAVRSDLRGSTPTAALRAGGLLCETDDVPFGVELAPLEILQTAERALAIESEAMRVFESDPPDFVDLAFGVARIARPLFAGWGFEQYEDDSELVLVGYDGTTAHEVSLPLASAEDDVDRVLRFLGELATTMSSDLQLALVAAAPDDAATHLVALSQTTLENALRDEVFFEAPLPPL